MRLHFTFIVALILSSCASGPTYEQQLAAQDRATLEEWRVFTEHLETLRDENGKPKRPLTSEENDKLQEFRQKAREMVARHEIQARSANYNTTYLTPSYYETPRPSWTPPARVSSSTGSSFGGFESDRLRATPNGFGGFNISDGYGNTVRATPQPDGDGRYILRDQNGNRGSLTPTAGGNYIFRDHEGNSSTVRKGADGTYRTNF